MSKIEWKSKFFFFEKFKLAESNRSPNFHSPLKEEYYGPRFFFLIPPKCRTIQLVLARLYRGSSNKIHKFRGATQSLFDHPPPMHHFVDNSAWTGVGQINFGNPQNFMVVNNSTKKFGFIFFSFDQKPWEKSKQKIRFFAYFIFPRIFLFPSDISQLDKKNERE